MTTGERIIMIRLMEKAGKYPEFAKKLGIEVASNNLRIKGIDPKSFAVL